MLTCWCDGVLLRNRVEDVVNTPVASARTRSGGAPAGSGGPPVQPYGNFCAKQAAGFPATCCKHAKTVLERASSIHPIPGEAPTATGDVSFVGNAAKEQVGTVPVAC